MKARGFFSVIYEDDEIIVVDKAPGISVIGDRWDESAERLDRLVSARLGGAKVYTAHRIDRDTSGLVLFAKTEAAHRRLSLAFEGRDVGKRYLAIVRGRPAWKETECDLRLVPDGNKKHMTIVDKFRGKPSLTRFAVLGGAGGFSLVEARPETGRTHQIRAHAAALGFPIACDALYGSPEAVLLSAIKKGWRGDKLEERPLLARLGLHAAEIALAKEALAPPGESSDGLRFRAPAPKDMAALISQMEKAAGSIFIPNGVY
ncbi:MAG: RNA pseudouridine synthase [Treponema sp.]|nr:RNA pseudouridine synthase [Treponema sp.]